MGESEMSGKERMSIVLSGGKPDRVPVYGIYDNSYLSAGVGKDPRAFFTATSEERISLIEESFLRHKVDGFFVWEGTTDEWVRHHEVEKGEEYWLITHTRDGTRKRLLPNGTWLNEDGSSEPRQGLMGSESMIQDEGDIARLVPRPYAGDEEDLTHWFAPLKHLSSKYPDHFFSFHIPAPMSVCLDYCGGYMEGLMMLASEPELFRKVLRAATERNISRLRAGRDAGGSAILLTSYYSGADTISPQFYADEVFPFERELCEEAQALGLKVMNWYLGDLMPMLDQVKQLPIDALVLEQARTGTRLDLGAVRKKVGQDLGLFGYCYESDLVNFNKNNLSSAFEEQFSGAGLDGAFGAGMPIVPADANPEAVDYYINHARENGRYC